MPHTLSPSSLSLFKECPRCFWLHLNQGIRRPTSIYPSLPYGIDKGLKERSNYYRERAKLPPELRKLGKEMVLFDHPLLGLWRNTLQGIQWKDTPGNILRGAVDDVLQCRDKLMVLEYVTRGFPLKEETLSYYQDQLDIYTFLLHKNNYTVEDHAYVLFYYPKGVNWRGDVWFHKELHQVPISLSHAEQLFKNALDILKQDLPPPSAKCEFCQWRK